MFRISRITAPRATLLGFLLLAAAMFGFGSLASHFAAAHPPIAAATDAVDHPNSAHGNRHGPPCAAGEEVPR